MASRRFLVTRRLAKSRSAARGVTDLKPGDHVVLAFVPSCGIVRLYQQGKLPVNKLLSEIVSFEELNEAFDRLADGKSIRQVLKVE